MKKVVEPFLELFHTIIIICASETYVKLASKYGTWRFVGGCFEAI